jgi:hypothetical protein
MYKLIKNLRTLEIDTVKYIGDGFEISIPMNEDNTDYQAYLKWVSEGNIAEQAD